MRRRYLGLSIWDLDPKQCKGHEVSELEQLFADAYRHAFFMRGTPEVLRPFLDRYLHYRVIPLWVRRYIREVLESAQYAEIAEAPLDPAMDWNRVSWAGQMLWLTWGARLTRPHLRGYWLRA